MQNTPVIFHTFGGLDVSRDPGLVGASSAVTLSNVDVDIPGSLRTRPGRVNVTSGDSTSSGPYTKVIAPPRGTSTSNLAYAVTANNFREYRNATTITDTACNTGTSYLPDLVSYASDKVAVIDGTAFRIWDGTAHSISGVSGAPVAGLVGNWASEARLVTVGAGAAGANTDRIWFSDAGAVTFGANNWVEVDPTREKITGYAELGTLFIVFKQTRMYVFYNVSVDTDGNPVFNYRAVNLGDTITASKTSGMPGRMSSDGQYAYFVAARGVYRTTGGPPELISTQLAAIFRSELVAFGSSWSSSPTTWAQATPDRVYIGDEGNAPGLLVLDKATGQWVWYTTKGTALCSDGHPRGGYVLDVTFGRLTQFQAGTDDIGSPISWSWQSGLYDLSQRGLTSISRESSIRGTGTVTLTLSSDLYSDQSGSVTLGTAPTIAEAWLQKDQEGLYWQHSVSGTGSASVSSITHYVTFVKGEAEER